MFSGPLSSSQPRQKLPFTCRPLHGCRGCGKSVCIGFERWMKHIPAEAQVLVFLTGSKVGLGTPWHRIRGLFGPPLGLESCWGFAVSHASRCRGCGNSVCIGFERWMKHTSRGSGPSVFNGFEGRVRHTLASHSGPFWATSWA